MVAGHIASVALHGVVVTPQVEGPQSTSRVKVRVGQRRRVTLDRRTGCLLDEVAVLKAGQVKLHLSSLGVRVALVALPGKRVAVVSPRPGGGGMVDIGWIVTDDPGTTLGALQGASIGALTSPRTSSTVDSDSWNNLRRSSQRDVAREEFHTWVLVRVVHADGAATDPRVGVTTLRASIDHELMAAVAGAGELPAGPYSATDRSTHVPPPSGFVVVTGERPSKTHSRLVVFVAQTAVNARCLEFLTSHNE